MSGFTILRLCFLLSGLVCTGGAWLYFADFESVGAGVFWTAALAVVLFGVVWGVAAGEGLTCKNTASVMGVPYRFSLSTECLVQVRGIWVPLDQARLFLDGAT